MLDNRRQAICYTTCLRGFRCTLSFLQQTNELINDVFMDFFIGHSITRQRE